MKVGIMTFWWSDDNYGQLLQCYALQKYLQNIGHDPYLIRYKWYSDVRKNPLPIRILKALNPAFMFKYLKKKKNKAKIKIEVANNPRYFDDFRKRYITQSKTLFSSLQQLQQNPPPADIYIVGSDQVWNFWNNPVRRFRNIIHAYFLDFGSPETKRISFAASWGVKKISQEYIKEISPLLAKFDYVSVREESGIDLCKQCGVDAKWLADPTMFLSADVYRKLYKENQMNNMPQGKYLVLYAVNNNSKFDIQAVYDFAKSKKLEVIYITGNGTVDKYPKYFATIPQWLYLIDNAEYVITNSFHCCVFSILFNKQFAALALNGKHAGMNSRLDSLFKHYKIEPRFIIANDFSILDKKYTASSETCNIKNYFT
ncbi:MAG: polysaccharide pyruvyl transferase family protein [Spirochaetales bacterium]|nr:polysaccharide pyruvyl transferase family protein [Spirochaetales bacterium]